MYTFDCLHAFDGFKSLQFSTVDVLNRKLGIAFTLPELICICHPTICDFHKSIFQCCRTPCIAALLTLTSFLKLKDCISVRLEEPFQSHSSIKYFLSLRIHNEYPLL